MKDQRASLSSSVSVLSLLVMVSHDKVWPLTSRFFQGSTRVVISVVSSVLVWGKTWGELCGWVLVLELIHAHEYSEGLLLSNCCLFLQCACCTIAKCRVLIDMYIKIDICANKPKLWGGVDGSRVRKIILELGLCCIWPLLVHLAWKKRPLCFCNFLLYVQLQGVVIYVWTYFGV